MKVWKYAIKLENDALLYDCGELDVPDNIFDGVDLTVPSRIDNLQDKVITYIFRTSEEYNAFCAGAKIGRTYKEEFAKMNEQDFESYVEGIRNEQK